MNLIASNYEIIKKIGSGGGGEVYLANHLRLGKQVVLKADKRKISTREELLRREVDILKKLGHTYIPQVYDYFIENGTVYTVIDYIEGESLDKPLKRGERFSQPQVIKWATQLLEALCYLHNPEHTHPPKGYVHSDIKPANIMRRPNQDICLIDFNIALALGEKTAIGRSAGYASPEHYGLDFSVESDEKYADSDRTITDCTKTRDESATESDTSRVRLITPDVRSDIYSLGATLYHLLSGNRPARHAKEVVPLSEEEFSPQLVQIISKAMNPNPNLRYQTAEEMLYAFTHLRENDARVRRLKKRGRTAACILFLFLAAGAFFAFLGLKRMQVTESWLKLAEYSHNALEEGDSEEAVAYALQALPSSPGLMKPERTAEAQKALTDALGIYDLSDGYKVHGTIEFPSAPLSIALSPDGKTGCCIYAYETAVFDTASAKILAALPAEESALAEAVFLDDHTLLHAGREGLEAYDMEEEKVLWRGGRATSVRVSADGKRAAAVYKEEGNASIYDTENGQIVQKIDFGNRHQQVTVNDSFANPCDNLLALNEDGTLLGASFSDGSLKIYSVDRSVEKFTLLDDQSGYTHFEGGFYGQYFAFSASSPEKSVFAVVDMISGEQTGGFESESPFSVQTDETGIYVQTENILVKLHPVTGEQTSLVTTAEHIRCYGRSEDHTLITTESGFLFFDKNAGLITEYEKEYDGDFVQVAGGTALIGSRDLPSVRIMKYEAHPDTEILAYDPSDTHSEARLSADRNTAMLFSYRGFRLYRMDGTCFLEKELPDAEQIYDQQYIRDEEGSRLEVLYNDGTVQAYDAGNGELLYEREGEPPDLTLYEEFITDELRIEAPLHGTPAAYDRRTDKLVKKLEDEDYLTYVTQAGKYIIVQYITADGYYYGQLLNGQCEVLAELPYLCDVIGEELIFDYPTGNLRRSRIYNTGELLAIAQEKQRGEKE